MKQYLKLNPYGMIERVCEENFESSYEMLRNSVEGMIECVSWIPCLSERGIDIWCNEEGKINDSDPTIAIAQGERLIDVIHGNVVFAKNDAEGNTIPLMEDDFHFIEKLLERKTVLWCKRGSDGLPFIKTVCVIEC